MAPPAPQQAPQQDPAAQGGDKLGEFRSVANLLMALGKKYPEAAGAMAEALQAIQKAMVAVAGNPQRTPEAQAPPQG